MPSHISDLFGYPKDNRKPVEVKIPTPQTKKELCRELNKKSVSELMDMAEPYRKMTRNFRFYSLDAKGNQQAVPEIELMRTNERKLKMDWINFLVIFVYDKNQDLTVLEIPDGCDKLFRRILENYFVPEAEANILYGREVVDSKRIFSWYDHQKIDKYLQPWITIRTGLLYSGSRYHYSHTHYILFKEKRFYRSLLKKLMPEKLIPEGSSILPEEASSLKRYNGEARIFSILPILNALYDSGEIEIGEKRMSVTVVKRVSKMLSLPEFYAKSNLQPDHLALTLLLSAYCLYREYHVAETHPEKAVFSMFDEITETKGQMAYILLPHIKGFKAKYMEYNNSDNMIFHINRTLRNHHDRGWIDVSRLCCQVRVESIEAVNDCLIFLRDFERMELTSDFSNYSFTLNDIISHVTYPFIKAYLSMLATMGIVELAYDDSPRSMAHSYFDGMKYVRVTDLGRYAMRITNKYECTKGEMIKYFELDKESLVVTSLTDNNPYLNIIDRLATRLSPTMYRVSNESFLSNCEKKEDVEFNISLFRKYVCDSPSANWEAFFSSLLARCTPLKGPGKKYSLLQLPPENKELQRIFATEPDLREYVLKAEKYIVLVDTANKDKVEAILKKYGYLI